MNILLSYGIEVLITLGLSVLIVAYFRPHLQRILVDLCGGEQRAQFWTVFSAILLVSFPLVAALGYEPSTNDLPGAILAVAREVGHNMVAFIVAMIGVGVFISFFILVAPRVRTEKTS